MWYRLCSGSAVTPLQGADSLRLEVCCYMSQQQLAWGNPRRLNEVLWDDVTSPICLYRQRGARSPMCARASRRLPKVAR